MATNPLLGPDKRLADEDSSAHEAKDDPGQPLSNSASIRTADGRPAATLWSRLGRDHWFWEVGGMGLSLAAILSICAILIAFDQKPIPTWRHGITLNAVISFLATLAKASLLMVVAATLDQNKWLWYHGGSHTLQDMTMFEEASRGPSGALSLLFSRRGSLIAWFGAVVTVCAIGFEPFIQQLVTYPLRDVPSSDQVASMRILSGIPGLNPDGTNFYWEPLGERGQYNASIRTGIYDGTSYPRTMPICPNGNCRWPRYHAIAFCSKCVDVTNLTEITLIGNSGRTNFSDTIEQIILDAATNRTFRPSSKFPTSGNFKITPPNGRTTDAQVQIVDWSGWMGPGATWTGWLPWQNGVDPTEKLPPITIIDTNHTHHKVWSLNFHDPLEPDEPFMFYDNNWINTTVAGIAGPLVALGHLSMDWTGDSTERKVVSVQECALTPCVQEYEARVTNNTLFLDVLSTTYGHMSGLTSGDGPNLMGMWSAVANGTTFSISDLGSTLTYIALWANAFLTGSVSQYSDVTCDISNYTKAGDFDSNCIVTDYTQTDSWNDDMPASSEEMRAIDTQANFSQVLTNVAGSMTDLNTRFYNSRVLGDVLVAKTFVHVRWVWAAFPLLLFLTSLITLSATIYRTKREKIAVWKSSTLPLLYCGPNYMSARSKITIPFNLTTASSMDMDAKQVLVQLVRSKDTGVLEMKQES